jgi:hypothetical protein
VGDLAVALALILDRGVDDIEACVANGSVNSTSMRSARLNAAVGTFLVARSI